MGHTIEPGVFMRRSAALFVSLAAAVSVTAAVVPGTALARFTGNVCKLPTGSEIGAAHVTGGCARKRSTHTFPTPLGSLTEEAFFGYWGAHSGEPLHSLTVSVTRVRGSAAALAAGRSKLRLQIIGEGAPVGIGSVSSWHGSTSSCVNPPTDDCTEVQVSAIVKNFVVTVLLSDYPTGGIPEPAGGDEPEDLMQEEADRAPAVAIAQTVARRL
jgi:hypothetical protein